MCSSDVPGENVKTCQGRANLRFLEHSVRRVLTRRRVDDQVVELSPPDVTEELLDHGVLLRSSPYHALIPRLEQEADGHDRQALLSICIHWYPTIGGLQDLLTVQSQHTGYRGTCEINVENSDLGKSGRGGRRGGRRWHSGLGDREGQLSRHGALAYTSLARQDNDDILDATISESAKDLGVWTLLRGRHDLYERLICETDIAMMGRGEEILEASKLP
jgi:hypothetical protein